jgi:hypothetical protein
MGFSPCGTIFEHFIRKQPFSRNLFNLRGKALSKMAAAHKIRLALFTFGLAACSLACAQQPVLDVSGQTLVAGRSTPYLIRHLPVSSFPALPEPFVLQLNRRGCLIPQTYQAHRPENVIHASFERPGSSDWAVLCSVQGTVSLLVFFAGNPADLLVLSSAPEMDCLQAHGVSGVLGFNWAIDPASPEQIQQTRQSMTRRPLPIDHDALADSIVDGRIVYRFYTNKLWTTLEMPED